MRRFSVALLYAIAIAPQAIAAEPDTADKLFAAGMDAMNAGDYAKACPLIEKSLALDPGMAAEFRLAECFEKQGKLASAWRRYRSVFQAANAANMADRAQVAGERAKTLEPRLSKIRIEVPAELAKLEFAVIERGDATVPRGEWNSGVAVDSGSYRIQARAPGYRPWHGDVRSGGEGDTVVVSVPMLEALPDPQAPKPGLPAQAIAGIALTVTGTVTLGVGGIVGLVAKSKYNTATGCNDADRCTDVTSALARRDARKLGNVATAIVAVGGGVTIAGLITWLTSSAPLGVRATPKKGGVQLDLALDEGAVILLKGAL
jgi:hypothetical protein